MVELKLGYHNNPKKLYLRPLQNDQHLTFIKIQGGQFYFLLPRSYHKITQQC